MKMLEICIDWENLSIEYWVYLCPTNWFAIRNARRYSVWMLNEHNESKHQIQNTFNEIERKKTLLITLKYLIRSLTSTIQRFFAYDRLHIVIHGSTMRTQLIEYFVYLIQTLFLFFLFFGWETFICCMRTNPYLLWIFNEFCYLPAFIEILSWADHKIKRRLAFSHQITKFESTNITYFASERRRWD